MGGIHLTQPRIIRSQMELEWLFTVSRAEERCVAMSKFQTAADEVT